MKKFFYLFAFVAVFGLAACGNDDDEPEVTFSDTSLSYGATYTIPNGSGITWSSSNDLVASVSESTVTAEHVGTATISSDQGSFTVTVTATTTAYKEPCLNWGASQSTVKTFMNSYSGVTLNTDDSTSLAYYGSTSQSVLMVYYTFENSALKYSGIALNSDYVSTDALSTSLIERYVPVSSDSSNYRFYFVNPEKNMAVALQLTTISRTVVYLVLYSPVDLSSRASDDIENLFDIEIDSTIDLTTEFNALKKIF